MSLCEETLSSKSQPVFTSCSNTIAMKTIEQGILDREKEEYFSRGGTVTCYSPTSVIIEQITPSAINQASNQKRKKVWARGQGDTTSLVAYHSRNKPEKRRLNITEKKLTTKTVYTLNIAGCFYGSFETEELAVAFRDEKRKLLNMSVAEY